MDNKERFSILHKRFGLDTVFADPTSMIQYVKEVGFPKKDMTFINAICSPDNSSILKEILSADLDVESLSIGISDELGFDQGFVTSILLDIRDVLNTTGATVQDDAPSTDPDVVIEDQRVPKQDVVHVSLRSFKGGYYTGEMVDSKPHGKGMIVWDDEHSYEGEWADGKKTGKGVFFWPNGDHYEGDFLDDKRTGKGTVYWVGGRRYVGDFLDDERTGKGIYYYPNGNRYEGDVVGGKRMGNGILYYANGNRFEGKWSDNRMAGGTFFFTNGDVYVYLDGEMKGEGILTTDGISYRGSIQYVQGKRIFIGTDDSHNVIEKEIGKESDCQDDDCIE